MLCHAGYSAFAGGFTGVDVFFTISGFVVTTSILGDLATARFPSRASTHAAQNASLPRCM
jgi:peptidoglycan/LPS O-acetylase OafA/YrhL